MSPALVLTLSMVALAASAALSVFSILGWLKARGAVKQAADLLQLADDKHKAAMELYEQASDRMKATHDLISLRPFQDAVLAAVTADAETADRVRAILERLRQDQAAPVIERMANLDAAYLTDLQAMLRALGVKA